MKKEKQTKWCYGWNIYTNYGTGWEVESTYDRKETDYTEVQKDAREYRLNGARTRITRTKWLNPKRLPL